MDTMRARELYEAFLARLSQRVAQINYDAEYDILYVAAEMAWSPEMGAKPRTFTVARGIQIDVSQTTHHVFGVEIADFDREVRDYGDASLVSWWNDMVSRHSTDADGRRLAQVLQHASYVH